MALQSRLSGASSTQQPDPEDRAAASPSTEVESLAASIADWASAGAAASGAAAGAAAGGSLSQTSSTRSVVGEGRIGAKESFERESKMTVEVLSQIQVTFALPPPGPTAFISSSECGLAHSSLPQRSVPPHSPTRVRQL